VGRGQGEGGDGPKGEGGRQGGTVRKPDGELAVNSGSKF